jgi:RNA polymerase sigma-70 factor (ECF subfamily)
MTASPPLRLAEARESAVASDAELVRGAVAGARSAQRALFDRYRGPLFGFCLAAARRDRDAALDLVQETFARAFRALDRLDDPARLRNWLFSIAANVCRTRGTQDDRRRRAVELLTIHELPDEEAPTAETLRAREERIATVQRVLAHVAEPRLREIVQLKYGDPEHTTREIAARLAIPHGTVTVKLMRFRAAIRRELCRALLEEPEDVT